MESKLVRKSLNSGSLQLVVFADQVLLEEDNLKFVRTAAHLIYCHANRTTLFWIISHHWWEHIVLPHPSFPAPLQRPEQLDRLLTAREALPLAVDLRINLKQDPDQSFLEELMHAVEELSRKE